MFRFNSASQRATTSPAWNISPSLAHSQAKFLVNILLCYWCMCSSPCSSSLGFFFSWLELLSRVGQPMLVSMDTFSQLNLDMYYARMNASEISDLKVPADWVSIHPILIMVFVTYPKKHQIKNFSPTPKKSKLLIRMANDASRDEREFVVNGLKNFVKSDLILVSDTTELINSSRFAISLLMLFFYVST